MSYSREFRRVFNFLADCLAGRTSKPGDLLLAVEDGDSPKKVAAALACIDRGSNIDERDVRSYTPIMVASARDFRNQVCMLRDEGAKLDGAKYVAKNAGHTEIVKILEDAESAKKNTLLEKALQKSLPRCW
ncbi:MAG: hypothetical protein V1721_05860 [Pseudomonadota bacterium]